MEMADSQHSNLFRNLCILHLQRLTLELKCPLCLNLLNHPLVFPCNHIFCNDCIAMSEESNQECPTCGTQCLGQEIRSAPYMEGIVRLCQTLEETVNAKAYQSSSAGILPKKTPSTTNICCNAINDHPSEILRKRIYANSPSDGLVNNSKGETDSKKLRPAAPEKGEESLECAIIIDDEDVNIMIKEEPHTEDCKVAEGNMQPDIVNNNKGETGSKKLRPAACAGVKESPDYVVISDDEDANTTIKEEPQTEDNIVAEGKNIYPYNISLMAVGRKDKVKRVVQLVNKYKKRRLANQALVTGKQIGPDTSTSAHRVLNAPVVVSSQSGGAPNYHLRDESPNSGNSSGFLKVDSLGTRASLKASGTADLGTSDKASFVPKNLQGYERPAPLSTLSSRKGDFLVKGKLLSKKGMDGWFRPILREMLEGFYPRWNNVPVEKKKQLWYRFLEENGITKVPCNEVYNTFMKQHSKKYRCFLHDMKNNAMAEHNVNDVSELLEKPKPSFMRSNAVWKEYVRYWCSPMQRTKSEQAKKNRASCVSRPDGQASTHGMGRKSLAQRIHEEEKTTGKKVSALKILMKVNEKKGKDQQPTGEYYDLALQNAILEYVSKFKVRHGAEVDPADYDIERDLWKATGPVSRGLSQGRVLGLGTIDQAEAFMV